MLIMMHMDYEKTLSEKRTEKLDECEQERKTLKAKALSALAHKLGRSIFYMLKNEKIFDENKFLRG